MKEKVLMYHLSQSDTGNIIKTLLEQLDVEVIEIEESDVNQTMGYLIGLPDYKKTEEKIKDIPAKEMLIFFNFLDKQLDLVLDLLKQANVPFIPLKAMITQTNVEWSFYKLYHQVKEEYEQMYHTKLD